MRSRSRFGDLLAFCCASAVLLACFAAPAVAGLDEWVPVGPLGGMVQYLAVHPTNPNIIYAPVDGTLYFTEDGGASWNTKLACPSAVWNVFIDPQNPDVMYALASYALHKSIDSGDSWNQIATAVGAFALDPNYPERLFIGYSGAVRKSVDGGATWADISPIQHPSIRALAVSPGDSATIYAGAMGDSQFPDRRVFKTSDGGLTWSYSVSGLPYTDIVDLLVDPVHPDTIFVATSGGMMYSGYGIYRSVDGGLTWSAANTGLPCTSCPYDILIEDLKAVPGRSGEFCVLADGMSFRSVDGGGSWTRDAHCVDDPMYTVEFLATDPDTVFYGCYNGVWSLTPTSCDRRGIVPIGISAIAVDGLAPRLFAAADIAYFSGDGGATWELSNDGADWGMATELEINPQNGNILYAGDYNSPAEVYRSVDAGMSWDTALARISVNVIKVDPASPNIVYAGGGGKGLNKSLDDGLSWTKISTDSPQSLAVNPIDHHTIYIGTLGVKKSTDGGATWNPVNNGLPPNVLVFAVAIDLLNPDVLYCAPSGYGVYKSMNAGEEWVAANRGLAATDIRGIVIDYLRPSIVYARSYAWGVFRSVDGARNWEPMNAGLPSLYLLDLVIDPVSPNTLYCSGDAGLFRYESSFDPSTDANAITTPPLDIRAFPNPFSNSTTVEYTVTSSSHVRLRVYDVAGREVRTLVDALLEPGRYRADLKGSGLSAGVYFIEGKFGNLTATKKCILVK